MAKSLREVKNLKKEIWNALKALRRADDSLRADNVAGLLVDEIDVDYSPLNDPRMIDGCGHTFNASTLDALVETDRENVERLQQQRTLEVQAAIHAAVQAAGGAALDPAQEAAIEAGFPAVRAVDAHCPNDRGAHLDAQNIGFLRLNEIIQTLTREANDEALSTEVFWSIFLGHQELFFTNPRTSACGHTYDGAVQAHGDACSSSTCQELIVDSVPNRKLKELCDEILPNLRRLLADYFVNVFLSAVYTGKINDADHILWEAAKNLPDFERDFQAKLINEIPSELRQEKDPNEIVTQFVRALNEKLKDWNFIRIDACETGVDEEEDITPTPFGEGDRKTSIPTLAQTQSDAFAGMDAHHQLAYLHTQILRAALKPQYQHLAVHLNHLAEALGAMEQSGKFNAQEIQIVVNYLRFPLTFSIAFDGLERSCKSDARKGRILTGFMLAVAGIGLATLGFIIATMTGGVGVALAAGVIGGIAAASTGSGLAGAAALFGYFGITRPANANVRNMEVLRDNQLDAVPGILNGPTL